MLQTNFTPQLPRQFNNVNYINSIELRGQLTGIVCGIEDVVGEIKDFGPQINDLLQRFMKLLMSACENPVKINRHSNWLATYGSIVLSRLVAYKNRNVIYGSDSSDDHSKFDGTIERMCVAINNYESSQIYATDEMTHKVVVAIEELLSVISEMGLDQKHHAFGKIGDDVRQITEFFEGLNRAGGRKFTEGLEEFILISVTNLTRQMRFHSAQFRTLH